MENESIISERVYEEMNDVINNNFQILLNKDGSLRELFKTNITQARNFKNFSEEAVLEIVEKTKDPLFVLNNFVGGDFSAF